MSQEVELDIRQLVVFDGAFGSGEAEQLRGAVAQDFSSFRTLRDSVADLEATGDLTPAQNVRLGVCLCLLGRLYRAVSILEQADGGALAQFYLARAHLARSDFAAARQCFQAAQQAGFPSDPCALGESEALRRGGDAAAALAVLDNLSGAVEQTAEYLAQRAATVAALGGNPSEVTALYERAVEIDRNHAGALFGLAVENDRYGNDERAMELYKRSVAQFPPHEGPLLNLGLLYEDRGQFAQAAQCYERMLDSRPNHAQAALFLKDAEASRDMYYDEDAQRKRDRIGQLLGIPVTDFELSVRSRNCLQKMGIMTLGDLARSTEQELLGSKNFGETSLIEIREMLLSKGLRLGQFASEKRAAELPYEPESLSADEQALLGRSISDLSLSVRARKCMIRLGISTIGELVRRTGDDLLECKNFGVTSLNEVREKLVVHALKLRGD
ncbi:MAG: tetratricopeptide repeat protein [Planctomycetes bacterium]|nr:tetratricopeptide repeat protein [Planctomycetota bacterium]